MPPSLAHPVQVIEYPDHLHWSATAAAELARCPRAYYWSKARPLGAQAGASAVIRTPIGPVSVAHAAWILRHLTTLPRLVETVVRQAAAYVLRAIGAGSAPPSEAALLDGAGLTLSQTWLGSTTAARIAEAWRAPWGAPLLEEFMVGDGLPVAALDAASEGVRARIGALLAHPLASEFRRARSRPYLIGGLGEPFLAAPGVVGWAYPDAVFFGRSSRDGVRRLRAGWVVVQLRDGAVDSTGEGAAVAALGAARWLTKHSRGYREGDRIELWLPRVDGGPDRRADVDAQDLHAFDAAVADYARRTTPGSGMEDGGIGQFPMTSDRAECARCRYAVLCAATSRQKQGQAGITSPSAAPSLAFVTLSARAAEPHAGPTTE